MSPPSVRGLVAVWSTTGSIIRMAGAKVEIVNGPGAGTSTFTAQDGSFSLPGLSAGGFSLMATKDGFEPETVGVPRLNWWENFMLVPIGTTQPIGLTDTVSSVVTDGDAPCSNSVDPLSAEGSWPFGGPCKRFKVAITQSGTLSAHLHSDNGLLLNLAPSAGCCKNDIDFPVTAGSIQQLTVDIHAGAPPAPFTLTTSIQ